MITNYDRSKYFGASDMKYVFAKNKTTKTWLEWWGVKCGLSESTFHGNIATRTGSMFEHRILQEVDKDINLDRQLIIEKLALRVNYDGDKDGVIYEVKTHKSINPFEITDAYNKQAQCQIYCYKQCMDDFKEHRFVSYSLLPSDYSFVEENYDKWINGELTDSQIPFEGKRMTVHKPTKYDRGFKGILVPELKHLKKAMEKGKLP